MIIGRIKRLYHPSVFQGDLRSRQYFEGWYFKNVSSDLDHVLSFIPGVSLAGKGRAFIQVLNGIGGESRWFEYRTDEFTFRRDRFFVRIGASEFSDRGFSVDIDQDGARIRGRLDFSGVTPFPVRVFSPGIMGWYAFLPGMECYHAAVSMNHRLYGTITYDGKAVVFDEGRGYTEKDWGRSMPESWIWLQANNFGDRDVSIMVSIAKIPWRSRWFTGFLGFLYLEGDLYRFATYTAARITGLRTGDRATEIEIRDRRRILRINARALSAGVLKAPVFGNMERRIKESVDAEVEVSLCDLKGGEIFHGTGKRAGMEVVGDVGSLFKK